MDFDNDADYDMNRLDEIGDTLSRLQKKGICLHGWTQGNDEDMTCLHCGKKVTWDEIDELRAMYL